MLDLALCMVYCLISEDIIDIGSAANAHQDDINITPEDDSSVQEEFSESEGSFEILQYLTTIAKLSINQFYISKESLYLGIKIKRLCFVQDQYPPRECPISRHLIVSISNTNYHKHINIYPMFAVRFVPKARKCPQFGHSPTELMECFPDEPVPSIIITCTDIIRNGWDFFSHYKLDFAGSFSHKI
jgi:hypothetical protein